MYSEGRNDSLGVSFYVLSEMQNADSRQHKIMPELQGVCCDVGYACFRHGERPVFTGGDFRDGNGACHWTYLIVRITPVQTQQAAALILPELRCEI